MAPTPSDLDPATESGDVRKVIGFTSGNPQGPDMIREIFVLAPNHVAS